MLNSENKKAFYSVISGFYKLSEKTYEPIGSWSGILSYKFYKTSINYLNTRPALWLIFILVSKRFYPAVFLSMTAT